ncbi:MAG: RrF2 family transcriptional regulator [Candidatus Binataceae bacterium]
MVVAVEGARGGFRVARAPALITVVEVIDAIDGAKPLFDCREIRGRCAVFAGRPPLAATEGVCSIHAIMLEAEARMRAVLASHNLAEIADTIAAKTPPDLSDQIAQWLDNRASARPPKPPRHSTRPLSPPSLTRRRRPPKPSPPPRRGGERKARSR